jgi:hypothetical protein
MASFAAFATLYASAYYEGGARGRGALAPPAFLYACMAPAAALAMSVAFLLQSRDRALLSPAPPLHHDPSPCPLDAWLRATPAFAPKAGPEGASEAHITAPYAAPVALAAAAGFELLLLIEATHRLWRWLPGRRAALEALLRSPVFRPASVGLRGPPPAALAGPGTTDSPLSAGSIRRHRRVLLARLAEVLTHAAAALCHVSALSADVRCSVLLLLPDLALFGETCGFRREARAFRFSLRAAILVVLVTLTLEAACVGHRARDARPSAAHAALFLCSAWTWRALAASGDCLAMLTSRRRARTRARSGGAEGDSGPV